MFPVSLLKYRRCSHLYWLSVLSLIAVLGFGPGRYFSAAARTGQYTLDMPIYGQISYQEMVRQAESLMSRTIASEFRNDPALTNIEVVVLGERNGEIVPILAATVSRTQWQEIPQVSAWTEYYGASYALLQRHGEEQDATAVASARSTARRGRNLSSSEQAQVDRALDEGRLTGDVAQAYLADLD